MGVKIVGDTKLLYHLKYVKQVEKSAVKTIVSTNGHELNQGMQKEMDSAYSKGYTTGETKRSVTETPGDGGMSVEVGPETEYVPYVEYGTRFMDAEPAVRPAFEAQKPKFKSDMEKLVK